MPGSGLDRRWPSIVALSIVGHVLFFVSLVALDWWVYHIVIPRRPVKTEQLVDVAVLVPAQGDRAPLRAPPAHMELIDPRHLKLETGPDDTQLSPRSPSPGAPAGSGPRGAGKGSADDSKLPVQPASAPVAVEQPKSQPPRTQTIQAPEVPASDKTATAALPVSPASQPPAPAAGEKQTSKQPGQSGQIAAKSNKLTLGSGQSQYIAYVRQKIWRVNERIEPRGFVESVLSGEVVAVFSLVLDRGGGGRSNTPPQSLGHKNPAKNPPQAPFLAGPFEGKPPDPPHTFEVSV